MNNPYERPRKKNKVGIETTDGRTIDAELYTNLDEGIFQHLNSAGDFVEVDDANGRKMFLAKASIKRVIPHSDLMHKDRKASYFAQNTAGAHLFSEDPYVVLSVKKEADDQALRAAYYALARKYHPDRLSTMDLPADILGHADDMLKRINQAYDIIMRERRDEAASA